MRLWADLNGDDRLVSAHRGVHCFHGAIRDDAGTYIAVWRERYGRFLRNMANPLPRFDEPQECLALQPDINARCGRINTILPAQFDSRALSALGAHNRSTIGNCCAAEYREYRFVEAG